MRKGETVMEYYSRIKRIMESAKASLKDEFTEAQVPHMTVMLEGIALESFKRGLTDDLLYAMSVQEPETLEAALKIAQRIERDMGGMDDRKANLNVFETTRKPEHDSRYVRFSQDKDRSTSPYRETQTMERGRQQYVPYGRRNDESQYRSSSPFQERRPDSPHAIQKPINERPLSPYRGRSPERGYAYGQQSTRGQGNYQQSGNQRPYQNGYDTRRTQPRNFQPRQPYPSYWQPPLDAGYQYHYLPPMSYNYQYTGHPFFAPPPSVFQGQPSPKPSEVPRSNLNSMAARQQDAPASESHPRSNLCQPKN